MTAAETISDLREFVDRMLKILKLRSPTSTSEMDRLTQYNEQSVAIDLRSISPEMAESIANELYIVTEQYSILRKVYIAASYAVVVDSCLEHVQYLTEVSSKDRLSPTEIDQRTAAEETLRVAQEKLADALEFS